MDKKVELFEWLLSSVWDHLDDLSNYHAVPRGEIVAKKKIIIKFIKRIDLVPSVIDKAQINAEYLDETFYNSLYLSYPELKKHSSRFIDLSVINFLQYIGVMSN